MIQSNIRTIINIAKKRKNLLLYGIIGVSGATLDFVLYLLFHFMFHIPAPVASFLSVSVGVVNNFLLNAFFNFKKRDYIWARFTYFYLIGLTGAIASALLIALFVRFGAHAIQAKLLTIVPVVLVQYFVNKELAFRDRDYKEFRLIEKRHLVMVLLLSPLVLLLVHYLWLVTVSAMGYDDSYNLQVPQNLALHGLYATNGGEFTGTLKLFDPYISTGPTLLVPIAIMFKLFGVGVWQARILTTLIVLGMFYAIYLCINAAAQRATISKNDTYILLVVAAVLAFTLTDFRNILISAMGEPLAICLFLFAAYHLNKRPMWASALLGLAVLTKTIFLIAVPPLLVLIFLTTWSKNIWYSAKQLSISTAAIIIPTFLFQLYTFMALGHGVHRYVASVKEYVLFFKTSGSGAVENSTSILSALDAKIKIFAHIDVTFANTATRLLVLCLLAYIVIVLVKVIRQILLPAFLKNYFSDCTLMLMAATAFLWFLWWFIVSDRSDPRHLVPATVIGVVWLCGTILYTYKQAFGRYSFAFLAAVWLLAIIPTVSIVTNSHPYFGRLSDQIRNANAVRTYYANDQLYHFGWWQNPEVQFLEGMRSQPANPLPATGSVLMGQTEESLDITEYTQEKSLCSSTVVLNKDYMICKLGK